MKEYSAFLKSPHIAVLVFLYFPSCLVAQQTISETIIHDGLNRTYLTYLPENFDAEISYPLLLNFHGYGSNSNDQMWYGDFRPIADTAGFIIVHPQGTILPSTGQTHFNVGGWTTDSATDDIGFTSALLDELIATYAIDEAKVYSTGMSNGGFMSFRLACELSDRITAIASVTGSMTPQVFQSCDPLHPTPTMLMHGTADSVVPYAGDATWTIGVEEVAEYWRDVNACELTPEVIQVPDIDLTDQSTAELIKYSNGNNGAEVHLYKLTGAGHTWPGNFLGTFNTNNDIVGSVEIWKFLSQYDLNTLNMPVDVSVTENLSKEWTISYSDNAQQITVHNSGEVNADYSIFNLEGALISRGNLNGKNKITFENKPSAIYILKIGSKAIPFHNSKSF